jgi:hypothetical protein
MIKAVVERILAGHKEMQDKPVTVEKTEDWEPVYPFIETPFNYRYVWEALWSLRQRKNEKEDAESVPDKMKELLRLRNYKLNSRWKWFPEYIKSHDETLSKITQLAKGYHKTTLDEVVYSVATGSIYIIVYPGFIYHLREKDYDYYRETNDDEYIMSIIREETGLFMGRVEGLREVMGPLETRWFPLRICADESRFKARARILIGQGQPRLGYYILLELSREDGRSYKAWRRFNNWSYVDRRLWTESLAFMNVVDDFLEE